VYVCVRVYLIVFFDACAFDRVIQVCMDTHIMYIHAYISIHIYIYI